MPPAHSAGTRLQIGSFGILLAIAGTFGAWLGGKLDDRLGPETGDIRQLADPAGCRSSPFLLVDKDSILFVRVAAPVPGGRCFPVAAERAYLVLGFLIGARPAARFAGGPRARF